LIYTSPLKLLLLNLNFSIKSKLLH
jgi:hypothetical protein